MKSGKVPSRILGLDVGASSVGWALVEAEPAKDGRLEPTALLDAGVRIFEAGAAGRLEAGYEKAPGVARRQARSMRRRLDRHARRLDRLYRLLQNAGLLPRGEAHSAPRPETAAGQRRQRAERSRERNEILTKLDAELLDRWRQKLQAEGADEPTLLRLDHTLPYVLRTRALDERLEPHELGRALYHLAQRRGFLSNRKAPPKKDEDEGELKKQIGELWQRISQAGARTLGEYLAALDPHEERIRGRWTSRKMYEEELARIWETQATHHSDLLTADLRKRLHKAIFYQRPLRIRKEFVGACALETDRKRAPMALLQAQRFRLLQQVNHTRIQKPNGEIEDLTDEQRTALVDALDQQGDMKFTAAKKLLHLPRNVVFNFEEGQEKRFVGNRTAGRLAEVFGERWPLLSAAERAQVVEDLRSIQKDDTLERRAGKHWGLSPEDAKALSKVRLEDGHCRLSRQALAKLLPHMEEGLTYAEAVQKVYGRSLDPDAVDLLPAVDEALPDLRNPAVHRALTELRKVVNAVVRTYGRPDAIRVELGRDLRKSRKQRQRTTRKNKRIRKAREQAAEAIKNNPAISVPEPSRTDIQKVLLAEECNWLCPYTGKPISMAALLGDTPQFDIEHIVPFSRCLDNSYMNKTLCDIRENRTVKGNRTPWEAYGHDPDRWGQIIGRVKKFQGDARRPKLARFQEKEPKFDDFVDQQLNDTRYASRVAQRYLALLYGPEWRKHIQASRGSVTGYLRDEWDLNTILSDGPRKSRDDHRHHAVDAIAVALTERGTVKMLSDAAEQAHRTGRRRFAPVPEPWDAFLDDVRRTVEAIHVSNRVSRKVSGCLHEESFYSPPKEDDDGQEWVHVRKTLGKNLRKDEIPHIVDPVVRERVAQRLEELDGDLQALGQPDNLPYMESGDGRRIPIRKVRVRKPPKSVPITSGGAERRVKTDTNHHVEIVQTTDRRGNPAWKGYLVSRLDAAERLRAGQPVVRRHHGEDERFLFSLAPTEAVLMEHEEGHPALFRLIGISESSTGGIEFEFRRNTDARPMAELRKTRRARVRKSPDSLRKAGARKVLIDPLGRIRRVGRD
ncbi:MAG: type II CRISPR RNA-guided endonuclease Cas9 [bacterium]